MISRLVKYNRPYYFLSRNTHTEFNFLNIVAKIQTYTFYDRYYVVHVFVNVIVTDMQTTHKLVEVLLIINVSSFLADGINLKF